MASNHNNLNRQVALFLGGIIALFVLSIVLVWKSEDRVKQGTPEKARTAQLEQVRK